MITVPDPLEEYLAAAGRVAAGALARGDVGAAREALARALRALDHVEVRSQREVADPPSVRSGRVR